MNRVMSAGLYELPRGILIHAYAPTKAGFLIAVEPSALLPPDAPDERVGAELIRVLKQEQPVRPTPHRSDYKDTLGIRFCEQWACNRGPRFNATVGCASCK